MEVAISKFRFFMPLHLRWNDLDPLGHVNNVIYIDYFQIGRGAYMSNASQTWDWQKHMFVIANISCDYWKEMRLGVKKPQIGVRVASLGGKSFVLEYIIVSEKENGERLIHASGTSTQVMIDVKAGKTIPIPEWLRDELQVYEPALSNENSEL